MDAEVKDVLKHYHISTESLLRDIHDQIDRWYERGTVLADYEEKKLLGDLRLLLELVAIGRHQEQAAKHASALGTSRMKEEEGVTGLVMRLNGHRPRPGVQRAQNGHAALVSAPATDELEHLSPEDLAERFSDRFQVIGRLEHRAYGGYLHPIKGAEQPILVTPGYLKRMGSPGHGAILGCNRVGFFSNGDPKYEFEVIRDCPGSTNPDVGLYEGTLDAYDGDTFVVHTPDGDVYVKRTVASEMGYGEGNTVMVRYLRSEARNHTAFGFIVKDEERPIRRVTASVSVPVQESCFLQLGGSMPNVLFVGLGNLGSLAELSEIVQQAGGRLLQFPNNPGLAELRMLGSKTDIIVFGTAPYSKEHFDTIAAVVRAKPIHLLVQIEAQNLLEFRKAFHQHVVEGWNRTVQEQLLAHA